MKTINLFLASCLLILVSCCPTIQEKLVISERTDTLYIKGDTVSILNTASDIIYRDTSFITQAFTASLDTIIDRTALDLSYTYPDNLWNVEIIRKDTLIEYIYLDTVITQTIIKEVEVTPFWIYILLPILLFSTIGMLISKLK